MSASSRTQAARRCAGSTREYVTVRSTSPSDAGDRAAERAPVGAARRLTSTEPRRRRRAVRRGATIVLDRRLDARRSPACRARRAAASRARSRPGTAASARRRRRAARSSSRWPTPHSSSPSSSTGSASLDLVGVVADADAEPLAQERPHRVLDEPHEVVELDERRRRAAAAARSGTARSAARSPASARAPSSVTRSKLHARPGTSSPAMKLRGSNGCSGWRTTTSRAASPRGPCVDHVEQLADRHRRRARGVRALVVAGVGDDQPVGRGQQRVEQQLAVLGARRRARRRAGRRASGRRRRAGALRGNTPSSRPSRQTTRCGTERIGTSVQTVRWPVRKFARVGRPRRRSASSGADLGERQLGRVRRRPRRRRRRAAAASSARCQASRGAVAVSASAAAASAAAHSAIGFGCVERVDARRAAGRQLGEAAGEVDRAALDVVERQHAARTAAARPRSSPRRAAARSSPARHVPLAARRAGTARGARRRGPSGCRSRATHSSSRARSSSSKPKRRRTGSRSARSSTWEAVSRSSASSSSRGDDAEHRVGLAQRAVGEPDAQVGRPDASGGSASSSSATSPAPNVAWISGANVSMSGHITMTSRGSSVGSSASRCRIASRSTSTWRARPWQEWTWTLRSSGRAAARSPAAACGSRRATSAWSAVRAACRRRCVDRVVVVATCSSRAEHELHLAGVVAPRGEQAVVRAASRSGRPRGGGAASARAGDASPTARATGAAGTGGRRGRRRARAARRGGRAGSRVRPNSDSAAGRSTRPGSLAQRAHARRAARPGRARRCASRSRRHSSACQAASAGMPASSPAAQARTISGRCSA